MRGASAAGAIRRGLLAGGVGGALMSASTNAEMRIRRRPPSRVPAQTIERLVRLDLSKRQEQHLVTLGHFVTSAALGTIRGLLEAVGVSGGPADASFALIAFTPDFVILPAVGDVRAPWRWSPAELATSALHHSVYATGTILAYVALDRRRR